VDAIGLLGSTGTAVYLDRAARRRAIEIALDETAGRLPVMVGIGALRTDDAVHFGEDAAAIGADAVLLAAVSYTPLTEPEVEAHVATVSRSVALPMCLYDNPTTTRFTFTPALIARLAQRDTIAALKTPAPHADAIAAHLHELRRLTKPGFSIGYSVDTAALAGMRAGADIWHSVAAGLYPRRCRAIMDDIRNEDSDEAASLAAEFAPLWRLFTEFGSLRVAYAALSLRGLTGLEPPRPILPLPDEIVARIAPVLRALDRA
jgi:4-hydroxy-tetrahydrodipicolinate synthase